MRLRPLFFVFALVACPSDEIENQSPVVAIDAPASGFTALEGIEFEFVGTASDDATAVGELIATWTSGDVELASGPLDSDGTTRAPWSALGAGPQEVVLTVRDGDGAVATAQVAVVVSPNSAPVVSFTKPDPNGDYYEGIPVHVGLRVADAEEDPSDLLIVLSDSSGTVLNLPIELDGGGLWQTTIDYEEGAHGLSVTVTDSVGLLGTAEVLFDVGPPNQDPTCSIIQPEDQRVITDEETFVFEGAVGDDQTAIADLIVSVESSIDGALAVPAPNEAGALSWSTEDLSRGVHTITLSVTDDRGAECVTSAQLIRSRPPSVGIYSPARHSVWNDTDTLHFEGIVYDADDDETTLVTEWTSDVDGVLGASIPSVGGDVDIDVGGFTPGSHLITLQVTDLSGLVAFDTLPIEINGTPTTPVVSLSPDPALTTQPLVVTVDVVSTDVDGTVPTYTYEWSVGGNVQSAYSGMHTLPPSATAKGETWEVSVSGTDGIGTSVPDTATASIINTAPTVQAGYVDPAFGLATSIYTALGTGFFDADGDPEAYLYQWFVNNSLEVGGTSSTFDPSGSPPGATFHCEMTAWDGTAGNTVVSASATLNTPPVLLSVITNPGGTADEYDALVATPTTFDVDLQNVTVAWQWHNQSGPIAGAATDTLTGADFDRDDVVYVVGTPDDGVEAGASVTSATVTIVNTPPTVASVQITPAAAFINTLLTCSYSGFMDPDSGDPDLSTYAWTAGGVPIGTGPTVSSGYSASQLVQCNVTPYDGIDYGATVSAQLQISNNPPVLSALSITTPVTRDAPASTTFTTSDPDGDPVTLITNWSRNGNFQLTAPTLTPALFVKGDALTIVSTPTDGNLTGGSLSAGPVTVQNATPTTPTILLAPPVPEGGTDDIDCWIIGNSTDSDTADVLTYNFAWSLDGNSWTGAVATNVHPGDRIPAAVTADDQIWECVVTVSDDDPSPAVSPPVSDTIEVRACGSIDFSGAPAGLIVDWTASLSGSPLTDMTLEVWVKGGGFGAGYIVTSYDSTGSSASWLHTGLSWSNHFLGGAWHHVARVWDSSAGQLRSYVDGVLRDTSTYFGPYFGDLGLYLGGASSAASANYWDGEMAGFRLSNNARYSAGFLAPALYSSDAATLVFVPMTDTLSGEATDDGPSGFPVADNTNATIGNVGAYCE
jgi:hypothetical protein